MAGMKSAYNMNIYIKNMVSIRCKMIVEEELLKLGIQYFFVKLGEAEIIEYISPSLCQQVKVALLASGLEVIDDRKRIMVESIKNIIIEMVHYSDEQISINFSNYLSKQLHYDYTYLANVFSEVEGIPIEKFIISHKIERIKELINYNELTFTEIAWKLHYSSVGHLSNQFKKVTGVSPSYYKKQQQNRRILLENV